jgi:hypothetical protein
MDFYQPYSILFSKSDSTKLRIHTRIYVPGYQNVQFSLTTTTGSTSIVIRALISDTDRESRIEELIEEFSWGGESHTVTTVVYDLAGNLKGKNALHTSGATQY